jgi:hypothetical protein
MIYDELLQALSIFELSNHSTYDNWDLKPKILGYSKAPAFPNKFQYSQLLYRRYRRLIVELKRALSIAFILMLDTLPIAPKILVRIVNASP